MAHSLNKIFKSIADPTRREIFNVLVIGSAALSITQIADHFEMTRQGVTKHIMVLNDAGLVDISSAGREKYCTANAAPLSEIHDWVKTYEQFWAGKLGKLATFLDEKSKKNN